MGSTETDKIATSFKNFIYGNISYYFHAGLEHRPLSNFPDFMVLTTEQEEHKMIDKAVLMATKNDVLPISLKTMKLCTMAQHIFLIAYRDGLKRSEHHDV